MDSAGEFKGRQGDAEHAEDQLARQGEDPQDDEAGERAFAGHALLAFAIDVGSNEGRRGGGEGIDEEEDGADGEHGEAHVCRMPGVDRYAGRTCVHST